MSSIPNESTLLGKYVDFFVGDSAAAKQALAEGCVEGLAEGEGLVPTAQRGMVVQIWLDVFNNGVIHRVLARTMMSDNNQIYDVEQFTKNTPLAPVRGGELLYRNYKPPYSLSSVTETTDGSA